VPAKAGAFILKIHLFKGEDYPAHEKWSERFSLLAPFSEQFIKKKLAT
jgi:hypothetical protein